MALILIVFQNGDVEAEVRRLSADLAARGHETLRVPLDSPEADAIFDLLDPGAMLLIIIGPGWSAPRSNALAQRAVDAAQARHTRIAPVFCDPAGGFPSDELPLPLRPNVAHYSYWFTNERWDAELRELLVPIERPLKSVPIGVERQAPRVEDRSPDEAQERARELEAQRRHAEELTAAKQAELGRLRREGQPPKPPQVPSGRGGCDDPFMPSKSTRRPRRRVIDAVEPPPASAPPRPTPADPAQPARLGFWRRLADGVHYGDLVGWFRKIDSSDNVHCTVFAPSSLRAGDSLLVQVFAHLEADAAKAEKLGKSCDPDARTKGSTLLDSQVARGTALAFTLHLPGAVVDDPVRTLVWRGSAQSVQFGVTIPTGRAPGNLIGTVSVSDNSVPIGRIKFVLRVMAAGAVETAADEPVSQSWRRFRQAFISYASPDRAEVLKRAQMLDRSRNQVSFKTSFPLILVSDGRRLSTGTSTNRMSFSSSGPPRRRTLSGC